MSELVNSNSITQNLKSLKQQIKLSCQKYQRDSNQVQLLAVSKTKPMSAIKIAYQTGQTNFAENYPKEFADKAKTLSQLNITWHFIGQIQSNKTKLIADYAHWIHSISSLKAAQRINNHCLIKQKKINVLIQINLLNEAQKSGVSLTELPFLVKKIIELKNLTLRGLMFIPPVDLIGKELKDAFNQISQIKQKLQAQYPKQNLDTLSFGMSGDWREAIACGSNCIRIGTAIFGKR